MRAQAHDQEVRRRPEEALACLLQAVGSRSRAVSPVVTAGVPSVAQLLQDYRS